MSGKSTCIVERTSKRALGCALSLWSINPCLGPPSLPLCTSLSLQKCLKCPKIRPGRKEECMDKELTPPPNYCFSQWGGKFCLRQGRAQGGRRVTPDLLQVTQLRCLFPIGKNAISESSQLGGEGDSKYSGTRLSSPLPPSPFPSPWDCLWSAAIFTRIKADCVLRAPVSRLLINDS